MTVSPDGASLVYAAAGQLHLRALEAVEAVPIRGTEGSAAAPFFSPDGKSVGYVEGLGGRAPRLLLKRIDVGGGTSITISPITSYFGATWTSDDAIVFAQTDGIWRVPASGGTPERIVSIKPGEQVQRPQMLPDGRSILFTLTAGVGDARWDDDARVVVHSLDSGQQSVIRVGASNARYVPAGHLLYTLGPVLFALPFDLTARTVRGAPVPLVEPVERDAMFPGSMGSASYDVSLDGTLVYVPIAPAERRPNDVVTVSQAGQASPIVAERRPYWRPQVSPDGSRVAVEVMPGTSGGAAGQHIWIADRRTRTAEPFTLDGMTNWSPVWTRDGKSVLFASDREGVFGIYIKPADGSRGPLLLHRSDKEVVPTSASPEGIVLFSRGPQTAERDIWTVRLSDGFASEFLATSAMEHMGMFSPDGKWIAYVSNASGRVEVYVRPFPRVDGPVRRISSDGGTAPVWAPDGTTLYFRSAAGMLMAAPLGSSPEFTVGPARALFQYSGRFMISGNTSAYDITPDGRQFVMTTVAETPGRIPDQIHIVLNWFDELKREAPVD